MKDFGGDSNLPPGVSASHPVINPPDPIEEVKGKISGIKQILLLIEIWADDEDDVRGHVDEIQDLVEEIEKLLEV